MIASRLAYIGEPFTYLKVMSDHHRNNERELVNARGTIPHEVMEDLEEVIWRSMEEAEARWNVEFKVVVLSRGCLKDQGRYEDRGLPKVIGMVYDMVVSRLQVTIIC
ncbi:hypothetical protein Tco_0039230 [Tanacetum coccineum]